MRVFHSPASALHDPALYFRRGTMVTHPEQADRYAILHQAVSGAHAVTQAGDHGIEPILAVHDAGYVAFLRDTWERRHELPGVDDEVLSGHFSRPHMSKRPEGLLGLIGYYTADTSTPIRAGTWAAIHAGAQIAVDTADTALGEGVAYALCRPPGHHAYADSAGGFCFLNNSGIAARRMQANVAAREGRPARVAILDIDVHHGNGTQGIFYEADDILTISVHADPADYFPYYAGYAEETGAGAGVGYNLNLPLPHGEGDSAFHRAIEKGLERIAAYAPDALVVALGLDASEHDPIGALRVTTRGFEQAAGLIGSTGLPTALIQEGGYLCDALPDNLSAFLAGFEGGR